MKKIYFIAPLVALVAFAGIHARHRSVTADAREAEVARETAAKEALLRSEREARAAAVEAALKTQRERKAVRDAADAAEKLALESRRQALDTREENRGKRDRLDRRLKSLGREIADEQAAIETVRKSGELARTEAAHLKTVIAKAEANQTALTALLAKVPAPTAPAPAPAVDRS